MEIVKVYMKLSLVLTGKQHLLNVIEFRNKCSVNEVWVGYKVCG